MNEIMLKDPIESFGGNNISKTISGPENDFKQIDKYCKITRRKRSDFMIMASLLAIRGGK